MNVLIDDWLIDWVIKKQYQLIIDLLIDWSNRWLIDRFAAWLSIQETVSISEFKRCVDRMIQWMFWLIVWWVVGWLTDWTLIVDWLNSANSIRLVKRYEYQHNGLIDWLMDRYEHQQLHQLLRRPVERRPRQCLPDKPTVFLHFYIGVFSLIRWGCAEYILNT